MQIYAQIFFIGHYLFPEPYGFPRAMLFENFSLLGIHNVHGQISKHISTPQFQREKPWERGCRRMRISIYQPAKLARS